MNTQILVGGSVSPHNSGEPYTIVGTGCSMPSPSLERDTVQTHANADLWSIWYAIVFRLQWNRGRVVLSRLQSDLWWTSATLHSNWMRGKPDNLQVWHLPHGPVVCWGHYPVGASGHSNWKPWFKVLPTFKLRQVDENKGRWSIRHSVALHMCAGASADHI